MGAIENMGELNYGRISIRPYNVRKHIHTMPVMPFFCVLTCIFTRIYIYICQRLDNTRVGANCNSPFHMGAIENMGELNYG